jgi:glycosyltransferase involved in cell wall biosynthesis
MPSEPANPPVTIGIPTFNRSRSLPKVLESILLLEYPKKATRLCFVDNQSTDDTLRILDEFRLAHMQEYESIRVLIMRSSIPRARNEIFRQAVGTDYVFFLDSDIIAPKDTIRRLLRAFQDPSVGMASLPWDNRNARRRAGFLYNAFTAPSGPHPAYKVGNGCNIVSMKAVEKVGLFNEKLLVHEDGEYCYRLRKEGFKIICDFSSEGTHLREYDLKARYYLHFMKDSANTYRELILRGSWPHLAKVISSVGLCLSILVALFLPGLQTILLAACVLVLCMVLNSSAVVLDDGIHVKLPYRPLVGIVLTAATVVITSIVTFRFISQPIEGSVHRTTG